MVLWRCCSSHFCGFSTSLLSCTCNCWRKAGGSTRVLTDRDVRVQQNFYYARRFGAWQRSSQDFLGSQIKITDWKRNDDIFFPFWNPVKIFYDGARSYKNLLFRKKGFSRNHWQAWHASLIILHAQPERSAAHGWSNFKSLALNR